MIKDYPYMQEEEFDKTFPLIPSPEGDMVWHKGFFDEAKKMQAGGKQIFTVIEGDDPHWYAADGFHIVNSIGYLVSTTMVASNFVEAIYIEGEEPSAYEEALSRLDEAVNAHLDTLTPDELRSIVFNNLYEEHRKVDEKEQLIEYVANLIPDFDPEDYNDQ